MITHTLSCSHAYAPTSLKTSQLINAPSTHPNVPKIKNKTIVTYCKKEGPGSSRDSNSEANSGSNLNNILLKAAWYGSEALGIAASLFRPSTNPSEQQEESLADVTGSIPRDAVVLAIKEDFERSYFVTGNLTMSIYKEDCEFADPAGSFKGLRRFKRNCSNFGSLLKTSSMKLMDWKDFENKGVGYWRFICVLAFPWRPILSATGYTEYYYDTKSGKIFSCLSYFQTRWHPFARSTLQFFIKCALMWSNCCDDDPPPSPMQHASVVYTAIRPMDKGRWELQTNLVEYIPFVCVSEAKRFWKLDGTSCEIGLRELIYLLL